MRQLGTGGARGLHLHLHLDAGSTWEPFQYSCGFNITMHWVAPSQELRAASLAGCLCCGLGSVLPCPGLVGAKATAQGQGCEMSSHTFWGV